MKRTIECKNCKKIIRHKSISNVMIFCDSCLSYIGMENEKGFGNIFPTYIYLGDKEFGRIEEKDNKFCLIYNYVNKVELNGDISEVLLIARNYISEILKEEVKEV